MNDAPSGTIRAQSTRVLTIFRIPLPLFFVMLAIVFGLAIAILSPPYQAPDEPNHMLRTYQVSEGTFVPTFVHNRGGGILPASIAATCRIFAGVRYSAGKTSLADILKAMQIPLQPDDRIYYDFPNTAAYSPVAYFPQALAIKFGRLVQWTPLLLLYLARFSNLFFWTGAGYAALRLAPGFQRPLFLLMLMPMSLFQAASLSSDGIGNSFAFLFSAMIWRLAVRHGETQNASVSWRSISVLVLLSIGIGMTKPVYLPLTAMLFLIPAQEFGGSKRRLAAIAALAVAGICGECLWAINTPGLNTIFNGVPGLDVFPGQQLTFLRQHPSEWFYVPLRTVRQFWWKRTIEFVGCFGWADLPMTGASCVAYLGALVWACRSASRNIIVTNPWKWTLILFAVICASISAICFLAYLYWNMPGNDAIKGLQGRYFIPIAPAILMLICVWFRQCSRRFSSSQKSAPLWHNFICAMFAVANLTYTLLLIRYRYYLPD